MTNKLILFLFVALALSVAQGAYAEVIVIVNPGVKTSAVSKVELGEVFTGAVSSLRDGSRVTPVLLKSGAVQDEFLNGYIRKPDNAFRAGWRSLVFSGQAAMPKTFENEAALVDYVAATPGAIGYISSTTAHTKVKTLTIR